jgi:toxin ParE1/3/4
MRVQYTATALAEIEDILSYIAKDNPLAAHEVIVVLRTAIDRLAHFPRMAIETDVPGVGVAPLLPYRYLIFFTVAGDCLVVRNVRHSAQARRFGLASSSAPKVIPATAGIPGTGHVDVRARVPIH